MLQNTCSHFSCFEASLGHNALVGIAAGSVLEDVKQIGVHSSLLCSIVCVRIQAVPFSTFSEENIPQNILNY